MPATLAKRFLILFVLSAAVPATVCMGQSDEKHDGKKAIRINVDAVPIELEPPLLTDTISLWAIMHLGDRLVEDHTGNLVGNLAVRWTISPDKRKYCFEIDKGRYFHDGDLITVKKIADSFNLSLKQKNNSRVGFYLTNITNVKATDDGLCINLRNPVSNFLQILSDPSFTIYKRDKLTGGVQFSGRYRLLERTSEQFSFERKSDKQKFSLLALEAEAAKQLFANSELEIFRNYGTGGLTTTKLLQGRKILVPDERTYFIAFNVQSPKFRDLKSRKNFLKQTDFTVFDRFMTDRGLRLSDSLLAPTLLQGPVPTIKLPQDNMPTFPICKIKVISQRKFELLPAYQAAFNKIGFSHNDENKEEFVKKLNAGTYDLVVTGYGITVRDWDYLSTLFYSKSLHNMARIRSAEVDGILDRARGSALGHDRAQLFRQLLQMNYDNLWYIPLTHAPTIYTLRYGLSCGICDESNISNTPFFNLDYITWQK